MEWPLALPAHQQVGFERAGAQESTQLAEGLDPGLPIGPGSGHWLFLGLSSPELHSSHKGLGSLPSRGPASSGPLRPSTLACFDLHHLWASCWAIFFGYSVCWAVPSPGAILSHLFKEDSNGAESGGEAPSPGCFRSRVLAVHWAPPCSRPWAGLWDPQDTQSCWGDRDGWRDRTPKEGSFPSCEVREGFSEEF